MTNKEKDEFINNVTITMRKNTINSVANGYKAAWRQIIDMLHQGKTKKQIEEYANFMIETNKKVVDVAIDKDVSK